jgi:hypothetical protein
MALLTSALFSKDPGTKFKVVDPALLQKIPSLQGLELTLSVIKRSGRRMFIQYLCSSGSGTLKLLADYEIEITKEDKVETLSAFIPRLRYSDRKPSRIAIRNPRENSPEWYTVLDGFWEQNPKNIYIKRIHTGLHEVKVPGAWVVESMDIPLDGLFQKFEG